MGGIVHSVEKAFDVGGIASKIADPLHLFGSRADQILANPIYGLLKGGSGSSNQTPAESEAQQQANAYLDQYNSGKLSAADQATANQADTNQTGSILQQLANMGMLDSSARQKLVGTVTKSGTGFQAGAGSGVDVAKATLSKQILNYDLNAGLDYLGIAAGQSEDLTQLNDQEQQMIGQAISGAADAFTQVYGASQAPPAPTDIASPSPDIYYGTPINTTPMEIPNAPSS